MIAEFDYIFKNNKRKQSFKHTGIIDIGINKISLSVIHLVWRLEGHMTNRIITFYTSSLWYHVDGG